MIYTDEMEKQLASGTSYWQCFRGIDLRRTEIVCMTWIAQTMSGTTLGGLSSFFYEKAGISPADSFKLSWGQSGIGAAVSTPSVPGPLSSLPLSCRRSFLITERASHRERSRRGSS
jgi:hypothetical protein